jgi:hypothetical protein
MHFAGVHRLAAYPHSYNINFRRQPGISTENAVIPTDRVNTGFFIFDLFIKQIG